MAKKEKIAQMNGNHLKGLLKKFKEERDRIEKEMELGLKLITVLRCLCKKS
ncbi:MAG: hypothetical protein ACW9XH_06490 [Candidatus Nitrosopumilus sp. bin_32a]